MNSKEIMQALLDGKKVGASKDRYMFLDTDGEIVVNCEDYYSKYSDSVILGDLFMWEACKVIQEEE